MAKPLYCDEKSLGSAMGMLNTDDQFWPSHTPARILPDTSAEPMKMISSRTGDSAAASMEMSSP